MLDTQNIFMWATEHHVKERSLDSCWAFFHTHEQDIMATLKEVYKGEVSNISADADTISLYYSHWPCLDDPRIRVRIYVECEYAHPRSAKSKGYRWTLGYYFIIFTPLGEIEKEEFDFDHIPR